MEKIVCPVCGYEYAPSEIYLPDSFMGKPKEVVRNTSGKIDYMLGGDADMDLEEDYICDGCGSRMHITANVNFKVEIDDDSTSIKINKKPKFKLSESSLL